MPGVARYSGQSRDGPTIHLYRVSPKGQNQAWNSIHRKKSEAEGNRNIQSCNYRKDMQKFSQHKSAQTAAQNNPGIFSPATPGKPPEISFTCFDSSSSTRRVASFTAP